MTRRSRILAALLIGTIVLSGCGFSGEANDITQENNAVESAADNSNEGPEKNVELTERQKAILEKEGLPTDYNELKGLQQDAIAKIEKCFQYLERTYPDDTFTYYYYEGIDIGRDGGDKLHVLSEKIGSGRVVTVTIRYSEGDKQDVFRDDYMMAMESDVYEEEITKQVRSLAPDAEFFVDASISHYDEGDSYIMERASGFTTIVMNDAFDDKNELDAFMQSMAEWMNGYTPGKPKGFHCIVFNANDYKDANLNNYSDIYKQRKEKFSARCSINTSGKINIF